MNCIYLYSGNINTYTSNSKYDIIDLFCNDKFIEHVKPENLLTTSKIYLQNSLFPPLSYYVYSDSFINLQTIQKENYIVEQYILLKQYFWVNYYPPELVNIIIDMMIEFEKYWCFSIQNGIYIYHDDINMYEPDSYDYGVIKKYVCGFYDSIWDVESIPKNSKIYLIPYKHKILPTSNYVDIAFFLKTESIGIAIEKGNLDRVKELFEEWGHCIDKSHIEKAINNQHYKIILFLYQHAFYGKYQSRYKSLWELKDKMLKFLISYAVFIYSVIDKVEVKMFIDNQYISSIDPYYLKKTTKIYLVLSYDRLLPSSKYITKKEFYELLNIQSKV